VGGRRVIHAHGARARAIIDSAFCVSILHAYTRALTDSRSVFALLSFQAALSEDVPVLSVGALSKRWLVPGWCAHTHTHTHTNAQLRKRIAKKETFTFAFTS
jgi:hypothetical protein